MDSLQLSASSSASGQAHNSFAGAVQSYGGAAWNVNLGHGAANFAANASAPTSSYSGHVAGVPLWALALLAVGVLWALK